MEAAMDSGEAAKILTMPTALEALAALKAAASR
jgi:hypothetical protein